MKLKGLVKHPFKYFDQPYFMYCRIARSVKLVILVHFFFMKKLLSDNPRKCILPNKIKALIILGEMHFLPISENNFFPEINVTECKVSWIS